MSNANQQTLGGRVLTDEDRLHGEVARLRHELTLRDWSLQTAREELQRAHDELKVLRKAKARAEADARTLLDVAADRVAQ